MNVVTILSVLCIVEFFIIVVAILLILHWKAELELLKNHYRDRELKTLVDAAISFIRNPESARGYDPNTNVGKIARAAFLKWIRSKEAK